ncbi:MAG: TetR/AcrR family transcriptional regulator [Proteobacteria bacterium]|nr:TetR/AcrR family transcriptional regulator [Pseudomonadota bacterium]
MSVKPNPTAPKPEPRWVRRKDARPEEITAAALNLFVERGYANTRLEDVAARAGVSKGTLYLYFANKQELFKAVVREGLASPIAEVQGMIDQYEGRAFDLLGMVLHGWWQRIGSTPISGIPKLILAEARNFPEIAEFYLAEVVRPGLEAISRIIERGVQAGEFRRVEAVHIAQLVFAPTLLVACWCNSLAPFDPDGMDPLRVIDEHLEMLRRGLAPDPG